MKKNLTPRPAQHLSFQNVRDLIARPDDLHSFAYIRAARHNGLFLVTVSYPDLTVQAFAVPAELAVRYRVHVEVLKPAENRIILRHLHLPAAQVDRKKPFEWFEYVRMVHIFSARSQDRSADRKLSTINYLTINY